VEEQFVMSRQERPLGEASGVADAGAAADRRSGFTRRRLLQRGAVAGLAAALAPVADILGARGVVSAAEAQSPDLIADTFAGLFAFLVPGNEAYSRQQGQSTAGPGGVAANVVQTLIYDLDHYVPASVFGSQGATVPSSGGVAAMLNGYALQVNPLAAGPFLSPFARLSFAQKAEAFRRIERDLEATGSELGFVAGIGPGFATFLAFTEAGVLNPATRQPASRPVGWQLTSYAGPSDGWPELRGYYQGRRRVRGAGPNATEVPH
jgi:hypothetical protein